MKRKWLWTYPVAGTAMLSHFIFCLCRCIHLGVPEQVLWISHIATLIGGIGAFLRNRFLISLALVTCLGHHTFWLFDIIFWLITGNFAVGVIAYLQNASLGAWLQTSNHFFVAPMLLVLVIYHGAINKYIWIWASALSVSLIAVGLIFFSPDYNLNCAYYPWPGLERLVFMLPGLSPFSPGLYLFYVIVLTTFGNYLPTNLILAYAISNVRLWKKSKRKKQPIETKMN
jgi:hypothetical protein